jgi:hypothetical protein
VASAAPTNAKNALPITLHCSNGATYTASVNGNGTWTPAVTNDGVVLVPARLTVTFTDVTTGTSQPPEVSVKRGVPNANVFCTFASGVFPGGPNGDLVMISGTALVQVNPRTRA